MSKAQATLIEDDSAFLLSFADDTEESPWMVAVDPHLTALTVLLSGAQLHAVNQRPDLYVSGELAIRFSKGDGKVGQVAPDLFAAYAPRRVRASFDVAVEGSFPAFVVEIVSPSSARRDLREKPRLYGVVGVREYVIFDPLEADGRQLSGYHRDGQGNWVRWPGGQSGALFSEVLGLTLEAQDMLLRLRDQSGILLPTLAEAEAARIAETQRADVERQRADATSRQADAERKRADAEAQRANAEAQQARAAAARIAALEAENAQLRREN
jgi:Uma2 family endonuclease